MLTTGPYQIDREKYAHIQPYLCIRPHPPTILHPSCIHPLIQHPSSLCISPPSCTHPTPHPAYTPIMDMYTSINAYTPPYIYRTLRMHLPGVPNTHTSACINQYSTCKHTGRYALHTPIICMRQQHAWMNTCKLLIRTFCKHPLPPRSIHLHTRLTPTSGGWRGVCVKGDEVKG
jgi:hypothetical protein